MKKIQLRRRFVTFDLRDQIFHKSNDYIIFIMFFRLGLNLALRTMVDMFRDSLVTEQLKRFILMRIHLLLINLIYLLLRTTL